MLRRQRENELLDPWSRDPWSLKPPPAAASVAAAAAAAAARTARRRYDGRIFSKVII